MLHIEFRKWARMLIVAPLDANTLAKFALGISDNFLTCIFRAWDFSKPVILAPAMNTLMWESPVSLRHLRQLLADRSPAAVPSGWTLDEAPAIFACHTPRIILIPPQAKRLACGDVGTGAMAEVTQIAEVVRQWSEQVEEFIAGWVIDSSSSRRDQQKRVGSRAHQQGTASRGAARRDHLEGDWVAALDEPGQHLPLRQTRDRSRIDEPLELSKDGPATRPLHFSGSS